MSLRNLKLRLITTKKEQSNMPNVLRITEKDFSKQI